MKIKILGKDYPAQPGWAAIKNYCKLRNPQLEFYEVPANIQAFAQGFDNTTVQMLEDMGLLIWCFIDRAQKKNNVENNLSVDDVIDWLGKEKKLDTMVKLLFESFGMDYNTSIEKDDKTVDEPSKKKD